MARELLLLARDRLVCAGMLAGVRLLCAAAPIVGRERAGVVALGLIDRCKRMLGV